jgi:hypothetical protein
MIAFIPMLCFGVATVSECIEGRYRPALFACALTFLAFVGGVVATVVYP